MDSSFRLLLTTALLAGCTTGRTTYRVVVPPTAEALSFLGDTLFSLPLDPRLGQQRVALLQQARQGAAVRPNHVPSQTLLAIRTAEIGRFRDAIELYSQIINANPATVRLYRRRGELLLRIRELRLAIGDLRHATKGGLVATETEREFNEVGTSGGYVETTVLYSSFHFLGMALYLDGQFREARSVWQESLKRAATADELIHSALWLFFATRRAGLAAEARALLASLPDSVDVNISFAEHDLLRSYKGDLSLKELPFDMDGPLGTPDDALYGYGVGQTLLLLNRQEEAALMFRRVLATRDWSSLPYLAAEADLARMKAADPSIP